MKFFRAISRESIKLYQIVYGQPLRGGGKSEDWSLETLKEEIKPLSSLPSRKLKAALRTGP
jgi:hypothetical protein